METLIYVAALLAAVLFAIHRGHAVTLSVRLAPARRRKQPRPVDAHMSSAGAKSTNQADQRWLTARHEAGHAVAALHYQCPLSRVTIEADGHNLGATGLVEAELLRDAVVIYCGPLAEKNWADFRPGNKIEVPVVGTDFQGLQSVRAHCGPDLRDCYLEAMLLLGRPAVQAQVDRVARALLERTCLTADEVREISEFVEPLCSELWR